MICLLFKYIVVGNRAHVRAVMMLVLPNIHTRLHLSYGMFIFYTMNESGNTCAQLQDFFSESDSAVPICIYTYNIHKQRSFSVEVNMK